MTFGWWAVARDLAFVLMFSLACSSGNNGRQHVQRAALDAHWETEPLRCLLDSARQELKALETQQGRIILETGHPF